MAKKVYSGKFKVTMFNHGKPEYDLTYAHKRDAIASGKEIVRVLRDREVSDWRVTVSERVGTRQMFVAIAGDDQPWRDMDWRKVY